MANHLDYFIRTHRAYRGTVYSSGREGMSVKFEQYMMCAFPTANLSEIDMTRKVWKAALSTRKPYGFGIVDKDGNAESEIVMSESGANLFQKAMTEHTGEWSARGPFRVVPLFYEDSES